MEMWNQPVYKWKVAQTSFEVQAHMHIPPKEIYIVKVNASLSNAIPWRCETNWRWIFSGDLTLHPDSIVELHSHLEWELLWYINQLCTSIYPDHFQAALTHSRVAFTWNIPSQIIDVVGWESNLSWLIIICIWDHITRTQIDYTSYEKRHWNDFRVHYRTYQEQMIRDIDFLFTLTFHTKLVWVSSNLFDFLPNPMVYLYLLLSYWCYVIWLYNTLVIMSILIIGRFMFVLFCHFL